MHKAPNRPFLYLLFNICVLTDLAQCIASTLKSFLDVHRKVGREGNWYQSAYARMSRSCIFLLFLPYN